jgi:hypothetical protein
MQTPVVLRVHSWSITCLIGSAPITQLINGWCTLLVWLIISFCEGLIAGAHVCGKWGRDNTGGCGRKTPWESTIVFKFMR